MRKSAIMIFTILLLSLVAVAQTATVGAGAQISGSPATGNCAKWVSPSALGDAGSACGGGSGSAVLFAQTSVAAGDTLTNACTGAGCDFASGSYTWAAGTFCPSVGKIYHFHAAGLFSTTGTAGNIGADLLLAGQYIGDAQVYEAINLTNLPWSGDVWITCVATGTSGAVEVSYTGQIQTASSSNQGATTVTNPANTTTFTINTTATVTLESRAHFTGGVTGSVTERQTMLFAY